jgi:asparagine synthase (glutamine-hydrolysing)
MSGIAGIIHLDGAPVDHASIQKLTDFLAFRGPDRQSVWHDGPAALGHALLRTTPISVSEDQPLGLDCRFWITAHARLDARDELVERLRGADAAVDPNASDALLLLHAYRAWGEGCLHRLLGDFAFAIWDAAEHRLFCARDHFGVRPFFYAALGNVLIFSNTLNCVRQHAAVSERLDEIWMGDFLINDHPGDPERTVFADIRRLPMAHALTFDASGLRVCRYWTLPIDDQINYADSAQYVEHFQSIFATVVRDRLRVPRTAIFMSGGLDSTSLAAMACRQLQKTHDGSHLRAYITGYERLYADPEPTYARLAAQALGIQLQLQPADDCVAYPDWGRAHSVNPEPVTGPMVHCFNESHRQAAAHARIGFTGHGVDPALAWPANYFANLARQFRLWRLAHEIAGFYRSHGQLPPLGLATRWRRWTGKNSSVAVGCPSWLNREFAAGLDLPARQRVLQHDPLGPHPGRPEASGYLTSYSWQIIFERRDAGVTGAQLEMCHPYFDLRLVRFLLAVPPYPWCIRKELLRQAMKGMLPDTIRLRPKTTPKVDSIPLAFRHLDRAQLRSHVLHPLVDPFIVRERVPSLGQGLRRDERKPALG